MGLINGVFQTDDHDQLEVDETVPGARFWARVEVRSETVFIVEGSGGITGHPPDLPVRALTADFFEALSTCKEWALQDVNLLVYARPIGTSANKSVFGRISEAFGSTASSPVFIKLESGDLLSVGLQSQGKPVEFNQRLFPF